MTGAVHAADRIGLLTPLKVAGSIANRRTVL
jgi:hypothetical protein